jgi:hypothetical protein
MMKAMVVMVGLLLAGTPASAMTGQEFLQVSDKAGTDVAAVMRPIVRQFVGEAFLTGIPLVIWRGG